MLFRQLFRHRKTAEKKKFVSIKNVIRICEYFLRHSIWCRKKNTAQYINKLVLFGVRVCISCRARFTPNTAMDF